MMLYADGHSDQDSWQHTRHCHKQPGGRQLWRQGQARGGLAQCMSMGAHGSPFCSIQGSLHVLYRAPAYVVGPREEVMQGLATARAV